MAQKNQAHRDHIPKEGWQDQEDFDSEQVKSDKPTTFVKYDNSGAAFITLAGWTKLANERKVVITSLEVTETQLYFQGLASGYASDDEGGEHAMRWGGHTEPKSDLYTGEVDPFAFAKCLSKTQRNLFKIIFYGDPEVEEMLDEFELNNKWVPPTQQPRKPTRQQSQPPAQQEQATPLNLKRMRMCQRINLRRV